MSAFSATTLSTIGLILSCYALYVEHKVQHLKEGENFTAMCDIEAIQASCSAVFQLPQGHLLSYFGLVSNDSIFNVPNAALGAIYYTYQLMARSYFPYSFTVIAACMAMASSIFLAYQLTIIRELCILCWTTHLLNTLLLYDTLITLPKSIPAYTTTTKHLKES